KDINSQEVELALSTQLLNNKLAINGNFDVRGANNAFENPITGDFDIEYKLAEKIRFKVFNRYNNFYTGMGASYTQGLGLFFQQEFNKLSDLFGKKNKSEMKKEEQPEVKKRVNK
ncbi:MAG: translocation/assembly module TamB domain-containing protein, partial [Bacteroidales bacterium]